MRLINTQTLEIDEFVGSSAPRYAILSHTWEDEEVTYQDMLSPKPKLTDKKGYSKILGTCRQASKDLLSYVWVDTCCIDKTSSAELTEAINSMFEWYRAAAKCYVYLSDMPLEFSVSESLTQCRWFTRGWTLQELLAPKTLEFYDNAWVCRGSKSDFEDLIAKHTGIDVTALGSVRYMYECSVATKMSWAANRQTTRIEDHAYSLLGLFGVNMALLYGEGHNSFIRLQEEIIKRNNDLTIFAWQGIDYDKWIAQPLLAPSACSFLKEISIRASNHHLTEFSITNKGLRISGARQLRTISCLQKNRHSPSVTYLLQLGTTQDGGRDGGICLRKIGPRLFCRSASHSLAGFGLNKFEVLDTCNTKDYYIIDTPSSHHVRLAMYRFGSLGFARDNEIWRLTDRSPELLWDETDQIFFNSNLLDDGNGLQNTLLFAQFDAMLAGVCVQIVAVCEYKDERYHVQLFETNPSTSLALSYMFHPKSQTEGLTLFDLLTSGIELPMMAPTLTLHIRGNIFQVSTHVKDTFREYDDGRGGALVRIAELTIQTQQAKSNGRPLLLRSQPYGLIEQSGMFFSLSGSVDDVDGMNSGSF